MRVRKISFKKTVMMIVLVDQVKDLFMIRTVTPQKMISKFCKKLNQKITMMKKQKRKKIMCMKRSILMKKKRKKMKKMIVIINLMKNKLISI